MILDSNTYFETKSSNLISAITNNQIHSSIYLSGADGVDSTPAFLLQQNEWYYIYGADEDNTDYIGKIIQYVDDSGLKFDLANAETVANDEYFKSEIDIDYRFLTDEDDYVTAFVNNQPYLTNVEALNASNNDKTFIKKSISNTLPSTRGFHAVQKDALIYVNEDAWVEYTPVQNDVICSIFKQQHTFVQNVIAILDMQDLDDLDLIDEGRYLLTNNISQNEDYDNYIVEFKYVEDPYNGDSVGQLDFFDYVTLIEPSENEVVFDEDTEKYYVYDENYDLTQYDEDSNHTYYVFNGYNWEQLTTISTNKYYVKLDGVVTYNAGETKTLIQISDNTQQVQICAAADKLIYSDQNADGYPTSNITLPVYNISKFYWDSEDAVSSISILLQKK